ncbi:hypothetical protein [Sorangium sp. So ce388]|uniref:hypothetical protein n=1 Tax=Sorangium sp. So ce388 TaxID=3133309 RepID=UPI003F5C6046
MKPPSTPAVAAPFRVPAGDRPPIPEDENRNDAELVPVFLLTWVACALTTVEAIARGETFGGATTLAALTALLVPYLLRGWFRPRRHR